MNIYFLQRNKYEQVGYDEYIGHVVLADTKNEARMMCPYADEGRGAWLDVDRSSCVKIGVAEKSQVKCVMLSSFNAG